MKKILLSFGVFLLLFSFSLCNPDNGDAPLSIISPEASDEWEILGTYEIKWKGIESVEKVDIELWKNTEKMYTLANDKNNDGTYEWKVPENTIIADDYKIKIISQNDESVTADSNAFSIVRRRTIKVISPSANDEWEQERNHTIKWESSGNKEISNIDIELWSGSSKHSDIATGINNTGSYDWNLGEDINTGSSYKIKIIDSSDETINTVSDGFNIVEKKVISIQSPATGTKWGAGTTQTIEWTTDEGVIIDNVNIELWYDGSKSDNIATNISNTGSYD
ncbi:MAG: Ser-Thr-rich GPI-anchored membrane family protein, partial [Spirochaetota bacterium]